MLEDILQYNKEFVEKKAYEKYVTDKYPSRKLAILSCMDTRLTELLPAALGLRNGDAKFIQNAGGIISDPFGSVMRSLLVAVHSLGAQYIVVIGHTDCGVQGMDHEIMIQKMRDNGISEDSIEMIQYCKPDFNTWLCGFSNVETSVQNSVKMIRKHPLIPDFIQIAGYVMDSTTGKLTAV